MSKKKPKTATPPAADTAKPFRLIVHIGAGKTGSTSIQHTLRGAAERLKQQRVLYLGMNLEFAPSIFHGWQRPTGANEFYAMSPADSNRELLTVLESVIDHSQRTGIDKAIWSNEWLFPRSRSALPTLKHLAARGIDVRVIAYVRRHDAWLRSSYVQWGLKHKTYPGMLMDFEAFKKKRPPDFAKHLQPWRDAFGESFMIRNLDEVGDAVEDFLSQLGVEISGIDLLRVNEAPSGEELTLRAMFNGVNPAKATPEEFNRAIQIPHLRHDVTPAEWLTRLLPDEAALIAAVADSAKDRATLDSWLVTGGAKPIDTTPLPGKAIAVDTAKLVTAIGQIVMKQALRLQALEAQIQKVGKAEPAPESSAVKAASDTRAEAIEGEPRPVFVLSTGRSGSTLVQRLLNCHKDLVVWGEHHGFLQGIAEALTQMADPNNILYPKTPEENEGPQLLLPTLQNPGKQLEWSNPWSLAEFKVQARSFIESYFASRLEPGQRWGFKEIRYNKLSVMRGLRNLYPDGRFVFVKRGTVEVVRSKVMSFIKEERWATFTAEQQRARIRTMLAEVHEHYAAYDTFTKRNPALCTAVNLEDISSDSTTTIERLVFHLQLDPERFDWALARQVLDKVVARTRRDEELSDLIRSVDENDRK